MIRLILLSVIFSYTNMKKVTIKIHPEDTLIVYAKHQKIPLLIVDAKDTYDTLKSFSFIPEDTTQYIFSLTHKGQTIDVPIRFSDFNYFSKKTCIETTISTYLMRAFNNDTTPNKESINYFIHLNLTTKYKQHRLGCITIPPNYRLILRFRLDGNFNWISGLDIQTQDRSENVCIFSPKEINYLLWIMLWNRKSNQTTDFFFHPKRLLNTYRNYTRIFLTTVINTCR